MKTMTRTKVSTKAIVATAILLVVGGAAYAATALTRVFGYRSFEASCFDGSFISDDGIQTKMLVGGQTYAAPSSGCQEYGVWKTQAKNFCSFRPANAAGQTGVKALSVSKRCRIQLSSGTMYGYGYNNFLNTRVNRPTGINQLQQGGAALSPSTKKKK